VLLLVQDFWLLEISFLIAIFAINTLSKLVKVQGDQKDEKGSLNNLLHIFDIFVQSVFCFYDIRAYSGHSLLSNLDFVENSKVFAK